MEKLDVRYRTVRISDLRNEQEQGGLNLSPGFQRKSVWTLRDRRKLICSILDGYPIPSIFLYRREEDGRQISDVIDGKQRLETIFMYTQVRPFRRNGFDVKYEFADVESDVDSAGAWTWKDLQRSGRTAQFLSYEIQVVEVTGDVGDIMDLFVRINSTGKALTSSEKRHAKFYTSPFLREAQRLALRHRDYLTGEQILSKSDLTRMRDVELVCELLASILAGGPIHKKQSVDKAVGNTKTHAASLRKAVSEFNAVTHAMKQVFPELHTTRFRNSAEYYSLFMVMWSFHQQGLVMKDRRSNAAAMKLLQRFSAGVDHVREQQRKAQGAGEDQRLFADYLMMVQQSTDSLTPRKRRGELISQLLASLFAARDNRRAFSPEQRRLLWTSDEVKKCSRCRDELSWENFQVDHIKPYSRGGLTVLSNAALICGPCNASKGDGSRNRTRDFD